MIVTKRGRPTKITDEAYRQVVEWQSLKALTRKLGLSRKVANAIRRGKYKQVSK